LRFNAGSGMPAFVSRRPKWFPGRTFQHDFPSELVGASSGDFCCLSSCVVGEGHYINWFSPMRDLRRREASVAQLAEQLICNQQVKGSSPFAGSVSVRNSPTPVGARR
jgi:hypothetical protein